MWTILGVSKLMVLPSLAMQATYARRRDVAGCKGSPPHMSKGPHIQSLSALRPFCNVAGFLLEPTKRAERLESQSRR